MDTTKVTPVAFKRTVQCIEFPSVICNRRIDNKRKRYVPVRHCTIFEAVCVCVSECVRAPVCA